VHKLRIGDLTVESFSTDPEVNAVEWNTPTYTQVGTCCTGGGCTCGGTQGTEV